MECDEELPSREAEALAALRASPLVRDVGFNTGAKQGVYARLWCARECHPKRYSEQLNMTNTRTTLAECAEELLDLINQKHGEQTNDTRAPPGPSRRPPNNSDSLSSRPAREVPGW